MPAPDRDPLCPRKATLLRGVGAKETDQTKASPCIRLKLHLVLKFTVTGSPVLNLRPPHISDLYSPALDSPSYSVKEPSTKYSRKPCSHLPKATLQAASKLRFGLIFHSLLLGTPHTPLLHCTGTIAFYIPYLQRKLPPKAAGEEFSRTWPPHQTWSWCCFFPKTDVWDDSLLFILSSASHFAATAQGASCSKTPVDGRGIKLTSFAHVRKLSCLVFNICLFLLI